MPPKRAQQAARAVTKKQKQSKTEEQAEIHDNKVSSAKDEMNAVEKEPPTGKRKTPPTKASKRAKEPRKGTKTSSRGKDAPTPRQLLHFLLSSDALTLCYPSDELEATQAKTYSKISPSAFTPFEHLLIVSLLSKPLSHTLGMRSTRTLLNSPFNFSSPIAVTEAGEKRVWEALEEARTQHRQKTASYVFQMGEHFADDPELEKVKEDPMAEVQKVKGMGKMGAELFCRRVQCLDGWEGVFPFADQKSLEALKELGLGVEDAEELQTLMEKEIDWKRVGDVGLGERVGCSEEQKKRVVFVLILERAIGTILEGNAQEVRKVAAGT